jgi:hypothetical protein
MLVQLGFELIQPSHLDQFRWYGRIRMYGEWITIPQKIASLKASIVWAEEQLALTRKWPVEERVARPDDWIFILDEFEADLETLRAIKHDRKAIAAATSGTAPAPA